MTLSETYLNEKKIALLWKQNGKENYKISQFISSKGKVDHIILINNNNNVKLKGKICVNNLNEKEISILLDLKHYSIVALKDIVTISRGIKCFTYPHLRKCLRDIIHEEEFALHSDCFERKKMYIEDVLWGLDFLGRKSLCITNMNDTNIFVCDEPDKAVIGDLTCVTTINDTKVQNFSIPDLYRPPEMNLAEPRDVFSPSACEIWVAGVMILEVFLQHMVPWALVDYDSCCVVEIVKRITLPRLRVANKISVLVSNDLSEFQAFMSLFFVYSPKGRCAPKTAASAKFLQMSKYRRRKISAEQNEGVFFKSLKTPTESPQSLQTISNLPTEPLADELDKSFCLKKQSTLSKTYSDNKMQYCKKRNSVLPRRNMNEFKFQNKNPAIIYNLAKKQVMPPLVPEKNNYSPYFTKNAFKNESDHKNTYSCSLVKSVNEQINSIDAEEATLHPFTVKRCNKNTCNMDPKSFECDERSFTNPSYLSINYNQTPSFSAQLADHLPHCNLSSYENDIPLQKMKRQQKLNSLKSNFFDKDYYNSRKEFPINNQQSTRHKRNESQPYSTDPAVSYTLRKQRKKINDSNLYYLSQTLNRISTNAGPTHDHMDRSHIHNSAAKEQVNMSSIPNRRVEDGVKNVEIQTEADISNRLPRVSSYSKAISNSFADFENADTESQAMCRLIRQSPNLKGNYRLQIQEMKETSVVNHKRKGGDKSKMLAFTVSFDEDNSSRNNLVVKKSFKRSFLGCFGSKYSK